MNTSEIKMDTVDAAKYLASKNGRKALRLFRKHLKELGEKPCKECGFTYALASQLDCALTQYLPAKFYPAFNLKAEIMDADPKDVEKEWEDWEFSDYSGNILGNDRDEYYTEVKAAFGDWCPDNE